MSETERSIRASLAYGLTSQMKPYYEIASPGAKQKHTEMHESREVTLYDGRCAPSPFSLEVHGFEFVESPTALEDFSDEEALRRVYYPEVEQLAMQRTGAARIVIFDHTHRHGDAAARAARKIREPVHSAHNDYTEWSAPKRVRDFFPEEADRLLARRFSIVQVWRPTGGPIESQPLAIADARTIREEDLIPLERRSPERIGETYMLRYNPGHRWYYFPRMRRDEALIFKVFDSARDGRARFTAHTAFEHPDTPPGAAPRESIEMRMFAFFED